MTLPPVRMLYDVIDYTWPFVTTWIDGPFTLRRGGAGGSRVSAATLNGTDTKKDIAQAEQTMQDVGQSKLFMLKDGQNYFGETLNKRGYVVKDPVNLYVTPITALTKERPPHKNCFAIWPPLAAQTAVWAKGGISRTGWRSWTVRFGQKLPF